MVAAMLARLVRRGAPRPRNGGAAGTAIGLLVVGVEPAVLDAA
jgi:hypothetical protein